MGGLRTLTTSPGFTMRAGLACAPLMLMRPFLQASEAMVRVLKIRTAHIHLSILASAISLLVELVHSDVDTSQAETLDDLSGSFQPFIHGFHVLFGKVDQFIGHLMSFRVIIAVTETQAGLVLCTQDFGNMLQPVVSGIASLAFQTERAEGEGEVIDHNQYILQCDFFLLHPVSYGISAEVHVSGWLEQDQLTSLH